MKRKYLSVVIATVMLSSLLNAANLSQSEIVEWEKVGVLKKWIKSMKSNGVLTPQEAKIWIDGGIESPFTIRRWKEQGLSAKEAIIWKQVGVYLGNFKLIQEWKNVGVNTPQEALVWKQARVSPSLVQEYKSKGITAKIVKQWDEAGFKRDEMFVYREEGLTPKEAKKWKDVNVNSQFDFRMLSLAEINTPEELKPWIDADIYLMHIEEWKKLGINTAKEAKKWLTVETGHLRVAPWMKAGVKTVEELQQWKKLGIDFGSIKLVKESGISFKEFKEWKSLGVSNINNMVFMKENGFKSPDDYEDYAGVKFLDHAIKLKKWDIKPNKLIKSMSHVNTLGGQEFYFKDKDTFEKNYEVIEDNCDVIHKKRFVTIDMRQNKNQCYIFSAQMIQRLDSKSLFGKLTQKGLVSGYQKRHFYIEKFEGAWLETDYRVGVIKGTGSFEYETRFGTRVVPKGEVLLLKEIKLKY